MASETGQQLTLTDFLLARIAEDEALARDAAGWDKFGRERATGRWSRVGIGSLEDDQHRSVIYSDNDQVSGEVADHIARHDPARVLAECEAKRRIVEECRALINSFGDWDAEFGAPAMWTDVSRRERSQAHGRLAVVAAVYADHPDYRDEWRP